MPKKRTTRVFWRANNKAGERRAYGDFRDYADAGGRKEALIPPGARTPTTDPDVAAALAVRRVKEFEQARKDGVILGVKRRVCLGEYSMEHLAQKEKARKKVRPKTIQEARCRLKRAVKFLGFDRDLASIKPVEIERWAAKLSETRAASTVNHHLNDLSNMFKTALRDEIVTRNPVSVIEKPEADERDAKWLEVSEAALLLEAARRHHGHHTANPYIYEIIATLLLTGARLREVLGLEVDDLDLTEKMVLIRPNDWRLLKTRKSKREVPLWPQLEEILRAYLLRREREAPLGRLLFPSPKKSPEGEEQMLDNIRKILDSVAVSAGFAKGEITSIQFRHTYATARLQTLDRGKPVPVWTVSCELGHGSTDRVEKTYGHPGGNKPHRSEVVEYRVEQHADALRERLSTITGG